MIPTQGRIVEYTLDEQDAAQINKRRKDARESRISGQNSGAMVHFGNGVTAGETYPMIIVRCWGSTEESSVNGQVMLDGCDTFWVTSASQGEGPRKWRAFPRV